MWKVIVTRTFERWLAYQRQSVKEDVLAAVQMLTVRGPHLGRPYADTIRASRYPQMKELRVQHGGKPLRIFFAFDRGRCAVMLCAGDKTGDEKRFYKTMTALADRLFTDYLNGLEV